MGTFGLVCSDGESWGQAVNSARNYLLYLACLHKLAASDALQLQLLLLLLLPQDVAAAEEFPRKNDAYQT